jgi:hypothetical protein
MIRIAIILSLLVILNYGCVPHKKNQSIKIIRNGIEMLYGPVSRAELFDEYPSWLKIFEDYEPDLKTINALSKRKSIDVDIFFGTWCIDSKMEVPRFFKILDMSDFTGPDQVTLWAVDREKRLDNGLAQKNDIHFVATFIFRKDGNEIGRIIEQPDDLLEKDILAIVGELE